MAWGVKNKMKQRQLYCEAILSGKLSISEGCRQFDISRPTAYKWLNRYEKEGPDGLLDLSSAREEQEHKTSQNKEDMIILIKSEYYHFGAKKIHAKLIERFPEIDWPGTTTIENILSRNGLVKSRRVRRLLAECNSSLHQAEQPNDVWCMDFKGWCLTSDKGKFDPFTLTDHDSRFLIRCNKLNLNNTEHVWAMLDIAFREYGLPLYLRSDNGPPFATVCPGRLSKLAIKLIKIGITPEWIEPGKPQQNGRHERMHRTMEKEGFLPGSNLKEQTRKLKEFREYYNFERPHEALGQKTPGSIYVPSSRLWNGRIPEVEYPPEYKLARVKVCGKATLRGNEIYVSRILSGEHVGLIEGEKGLEMYFGNIFLGTVNGNTLVTVRRQPRVRYS